MNSTKFIINSIVKYLSFDIFCGIQDELSYEQSNNNFYITSYEEYFSLRNIKIIQTDDGTHDPYLMIKNLKIDIELIINLKFHTLFLYILDKTQLTCSLNFLIEKGWSKKQLNIAFRHRSIYYLFQTYVEKKNLTNEVEIQQIKINSLKSAINRYNYPAVLKLLAIGIIPQEIDLKIAKYVNIDQITKCLENFNDPNKNLY